MLVLNEEQQLLKDTAAQFFIEQMPVANLRKLRDDKVADGIDRAAWSQCVELGLAGVLIPEQFGGTDFGPVGLGQILEQGGRTLAATPLLSTAVMATTAIKFGSEDQQQYYLPAIAAGELLVTVAVDEGPKHDPANMNCSATAVKSGFELHGSKTMVIDGHIADVLIVAARFQASEDVALFLVKPDDPGVTVECLQTIDNRNMARLRLEHVAVGKDRLLGTLSSGQQALQQVLDAGRIAIAAESLGLMQEVFDRTIAYLKERQQFGVVIGSFQALKHRAAEMYAEIEICRSLLLDALQAWEQGRDDLAIAASMVKAKCADTLRLVTNEGVQMHGGIGMTDELDIGLFMKRARVLAACLGNASYHRNRIAILGGY